MPDVFIHIGSPKTGTTAIQHFLTTQRQALQAQGVLYPLGGATKAAHHTIGAAVHPGRRNKLPLGDPELALATAVSAIKDEVDAHEPSTVILSTEYLWGEIEENDARRLVEAFAPWPVHVVAYLRRQDLLAQSLYVQAVKGGYAGTFTVWLAHAERGTKAGFHLDRVLDAWAAAGAQILARVYERGEIGADIRVDFLSTVVPRVLPFPPDDSRGANTAPPKEIVELVRVLNECLPNDEVTNQIRRRILASVPPRTRFSPLSYFSAGEAEHFNRQYALGNTKVAQRYLKRDGGELFRDPVPPDVVSEIISERVMLRHLVTILPDLARRWPPRGVDSSQAPQKTVGATSLRAKSVRLR